MATRKRLTQEDKIFKELMFLVSRKQLVTPVVYTCETTRHLTDNTKVNNTRIKFHAGSKTIFKLEKIQFDNFMNKCDKSKRYKDAAIYAFSRVIKMSYIGGKIPRSLYMDETNGVWSCLMGYFCDDLLERRLIDVV